MDARPANNWNWLTSINAIVNGVVELMQDSGLSSLRSVLFRATIAGFKKGSANPNSEEPELGIVSICESHQ